MRAPAFWYRPPGVAAELLSPMAAVWAAVGRAKLGRAGFRPGVPVVCVGNLVAGGAGKTPVVLDLMARLRGMGVAAHSLSRGYGGRLEGPVRVDPGCHGAAEVGDEPLLLAAGGPAWVARDRTAGARAMVAAGAQAIVMDDGFQNPALAKDLSLVVVDGAVGFGNGRVIPAGPLREPVGDGLARAQALVLVGEDRAGVAALVGGRLPVLRARLVPAPGAAQGLRGKPVLAFAGIGRPGKFFDTLREIGAEVVEAVPFPDHHPYTGAEVEGLLAQADRLGAVPVTTTKDSVRLPPSLRDRVAVLPVALAWEDEGAVTALLEQAVRHGQP